MCINWLLMDSGDVRPCHVCWQCKRDRIDDWVGRCIAESKTSACTYVVTLTYGRDDFYRIDHEHSQVLLYPDVQAYLKRLRWHTPGRVRFFVSGEYGTLRGRAHWHLVLFFDGAVTPGVKIGERFDHDLIWPHGFSFWEEAVPENMRYVVKYILKQEEGERVYRFSKMPELGNEFFRAEALRTVSQGLPPSLVYRFPHDWKVDGTPREYRLTRSSAYKFLEAYDKGWRAVYGDENWPQSDAMDAYVDERERRKRRRLGVADVSEFDFLKRWQLELAERKGRWLVPVNVEGGDNVVRLYPKGT